MAFRTCETAATYLRHARVLKPSWCDATYDPMNEIRSVCVYCGSGPGANPRFVEAAKTLGKTLADNHIRLVYGGGSIGLMGAVAHSVLEHGGEVTGIIPEFLVAREHPMAETHELIVTPDMHTRKQIMFDRADAFVALPGGVGTLEELVEQLTWAQLGRHKKPILIANIDGFWEPFLKLIDHMRDMAFIRAGLSVNLLTTDRVSEILPKLRAAMQENGNGKVREVVEKL
jgi:uncharacterized protein (TIGR00730 family)